MSVLLNHAVEIQGAGSVLLLVGFLIITTQLQTKAVAKLSIILDGCSDEVKGTGLFRSAWTFFERRKVVNPFITGDHAIATWFLVFVVFCGSVVAYFGAMLFADPHQADSLARSYVLGGAIAADPTATPGEIQAYESQTLFIGTMAFIGAYIWTLYQLISRLNNDVVSPITYYMLSIQILAAVLVASMARHIVDAIPGFRETVFFEDGKAPVGLALLGFAIGWNPTLWINEIVVRAGQVLKIITPTQQFPDKEHFPSNMPLGLIVGLVDEKIERLREIDIDNCQKLAMENAVIIWTRSPYTFEVIIDWIAQAQLLMIVDSKNAVTLRKLGIANVFDYILALRDDAAVATLSTALDVPVALFGVHASAIRNNPAFQQLDELRHAIRVEPKPLVAPGSIGDDKGRGVLVDTSSARDASVTA